MSSLSGTVLDNENGPRNYLTDVIREAQSSKIQRRGSNFKIGTFERNVQDASTCSFGGNIIVLKWDTYSWVVVVVVVMEKWNV